MNKPKVAITYSDKKFWNDFLDLYRSLPYLWWDKADHFTATNHDSHRTKTIKAKEKLLEYVKQRYPEADMEFISKKIHNFRCGFHREYRKKHQLEAMGQIHRPILWYYKKLLFLVDDENVMDLIDDDNSINLKSNESNLKQSNDEITKSIDTKTKSSECSCVELQKQVEYIKNKLDDNPLMDDSKIPDILEVKEKLLEYVQQRYPEAGMEFFSNKNQLNSNELNESVTEDKPDISQLKMSQKPETLSNSDKLNNHSTETVRSAKRNHKQIETNESNQQTIKVKRKKIKFDEIFNLVESELKIKEDMFDVMGRKIANDLREMSNTQRIIADKIINDVIYYGKVNRLTSTYTFQPSV